MLSGKNIIREIVLDIISFFGNIFFLFAQKPKLEPEKVKKVLFLKLYALGDIVHAQPVIPNIKANFPQAKIYWLVDKYSRTIVEHIADVDSIIEWQGFKTYKILKKEKIDLAFSPYRSPFAHLILWLAGIPIRVGFNWRGRGFALTHKIEFRGDLYETDRYLKMFEGVGLPVKVRYRTLVVREDEKKEAYQKLEKFGVTKKRPLVALVPGGGDNPQLLMPMKRWHPERFSQVADYLISQYQAQVVLVGGPSEKDLADRLVNQVNNLVINLVGKTQLNDLVAIISGFNLLIACDTGPLHIATALGIPTIGLFGPTDPELVAQQGPKNLIIRKDTESPIYTPNKVFNRSFAGTNNDPVHPSMLAIEAKDVEKAIDKILKSS